MAKKFRYKHISSVIEDRLPASLLDGEIAVNRFAGKEKLFIKNSEDDIISFAPEHVITELSGNVKTLAIAVAEDIDELSGNVETLANATTREFNEVDNYIRELSGNLNTLAIATDREFDEFYDDIDVLSATVVACVTRVQESAVTGVIMNGSGMTVTNGIVDLGNVMTDEDNYVITTAINNLNDRIGDIESILASI